MTYTIKPNIYGGLACSSARVPYVMNITGLGTAVENPGLLQLITLNLYKIATRKVKTVFFQNLENKEFFVSKKIAIGKQKVLPGSGVNLSYYEAIEYPKGDQIQFAFIGRIMKEKGIDQYLEAAEIIRKRHPETIFHICGSCEQKRYEARLTEMHKQGIVVYHGPVRNMKNIYKQIHCTIHPTYYPEGMSNTLLESAASARPIMTTGRSQI